MQGLLFKELIVHKKTLLFVGGMVLVFSLMGILIPLQDDFEDGNFIYLGMLIPIMMFAAVGMAVQGSLFLPDENRRWAYFIASTPKEDEGQVRSKYLAVLISTFAVNAICIFWDNLEGVIYPKYTSVTSIIYAAACVQLILRSIEIPFIVRFGTKRGLDIKAKMLLAVAFAVFVYLLFGDISMFGSLDKFWEWVTNVMKDPTDTVLTVFTVLGVLALPMFYASYRISVKLYMKGAEHYDK